MKGERTDNTPRLPRGRLLRGANQHHRRTVFSQPLVPGALAGVQPHDLGPDFAARFADRFGRSDADVRPSSLVEALLEAILAVERDVARTMQRGEEPAFARIVDRNGELELVWESWSGETSRAAARAALTGLLELLPMALIGAAPPRRDFTAQLARLRRHARRNQWSTFPAVLAMIARQRGLPHEVLVGTYVRIGEGSLQQVVSASSLGISPRPPRLRPPAGPDRFAAGDSTLHRLLVVRGVLVSALRCEPPRVLGDGTTTVGRLIERLNEDPRRAGPMLRRVPVDAALTAALAELDVRLDDVPPKGRHVVLPGAGVPERGAAVVDVTATVHDSVRQAALLAAAEELSPIASIDYRTDDVREGGGIVTAVNPAPELLFHALPEHGRVRAVGDALLGAVFADDAPATIPTAILIGEGGTRRVARGLERYLRASHEGVALSTGRHASVQGRPLERTARGSHPGPAFVLGDPRAAMLVATTSPRRVEQAGLGLDRCRVVAILPPPDEGSSNARREAVQVGLAAAEGAVVVAADDPLLDLILASLDPARATVVVRRRGHAAVPGHLSAGRAIVRTSADGAAIELQRGDAVVASIPVADLQGANARAGSGSRTAALHAAAVAFALGVVGSGSPPLGDSLAPTRQRG